MSTLEKLRQKRLQRQANSAESLEGLLDAAPAGAAPEKPPATTSNGSRPSNALGETFQAPLRGSKRSSAPEPPSALATAPPPTPSSSSRAPAPAVKAPPFSAKGPCPASRQELRHCVLRFMCGSSSCGPLPLSAVGLNAALRREFKGAGHQISALSVFRAADTAAAVREILRELQERGSQRALVVEETPPDDLLIIEADTGRICEVLLGTELALRAQSEGDALSAKRPRVDGFGEYELQAGYSSFDHLGYMQPQVSHPAFTSEASAGDSVEDLLKATTAMQRQKIDAGDELRQLLAEPTARQSLTASKFMNKSQNMAQFCPHGSRADCRLAQGFGAACTKIHFKKIIKAWTDESLGDCSYLDTCRHIDKCKYVHYALDLTVDQAHYLNECGVHNRGTDTKRINELAMKGMDIPAQWIQCDMRTFPLSIFNGLISVVMADPPWDIHMELPYGTLTDDEVKNLKIGDIHEDGMIFLWVTGRAMELARECFKIWGYRRIEEIIWVKTNQLQRIIRTGRTGHWINHSKEHCLVGIKGNPKLNRNLDCDVIVSEVRETSRKPDEIYNLIERMFPNCQKLELFGRPHNVHDNWICCGNQLDGVRLCDEEMVRRYNVEFPDAKIEPFRRTKTAIIPAEPGRGPPSAPRKGERAAWIPPAIAPPTRAWPSGPPGASWGSAR